MNEVEVIDIARDAMSTMLLVAAPVLLVGLVVGLIISLFQTLTHIQEMTLTFIPKITAVFAVSIITLPWMLRHLTEFTERLMDKIVALGLTRLAGARQPMRAGLRLRGWGHAARPADPEHLPLPSGLQQVLGGVPADARACRPPTCRCALRLVIAVHGGAGRAADGAGSAAAAARQRR